MHILLPFLNQRKGENDHRKYLFPLKNVAGPCGDQTCKLLLISRTRIRLSHPGQHMFVCVKVLWTSLPNWVMSSTVSLLTHNSTGQAWSSKQLTSTVHILSPETDNCPSWISRRERMTVENISWSIYTKECCWPSGSQTHDLLITSRINIQLSVWHMAVFKFQDKNRISCPNV